MKLAEIIEEFVPGEWGYDESSLDAPNNVACIRGADFVPILNVDYSNIPTRYISDSAYNNKRLKENDIIIEKSGGSPTQSTGRVVIVTHELLREKPDIVCSNFCEAFRVKKEWNPFYVFSYLQYLYNEGVFFNFEGKTSGLKNLQIEQSFKTIEIPIQKSDISILTYIDQKMALNRKINIDLEAIAKQIYDYWFVQFDFPNDEGKPYKSSGGKMVWNETLKREIPKGWSTKQLKDLLDCNVNGVEPGNHLFGLDYCPIDEIPIRKMSFAGGKGWEEANSSLQLYKEKDILIGAMRVYFHRCCIASKPGITRTTTLVLTPKNLNNLSFLYQLCNEERTFIYATRVSSGTQQPYVTWDSLSIFDVPYPNNDKLISDYCIYSNSIIDKVIDNVIEVAELQSLRDYLLSLLMNGQVTIKD